jgi:hypothetical protein
MSSSCGEEALANPTRMGLPRRIQGMEQEVCQLLLAAFCQMFDFVSGKRTRIAAKMTFVLTKEVTFVDAIRL